MDCDYGYNFVGDKLARKHWTMREMMKKTGMQLIALVEGLYSFCAMVLLYLIFNSSSLPMIQGIIITSVSTELKGTAFSIANLFTMMLTSGPAPVFYGFINDTFHGHKNAGMLAIMSSCK